LVEGTSERVKKSDGAYDKNIIGVITDRGTSNNQPEVLTDEYANVGMLGQVWVKVNLENGPIHVGDPLTSSSTPGVAMKAGKTGRILGRSLEDYLVERDTQSSTGAPPFQILMQVNVTWWEPDVIDSSAYQSAVIGNLTAGSIDNHQLSAVSLQTNNLGIGLTASITGTNGLSFVIARDAPDGASRGNLIQAMTIDSSGNIGIGTTSPSSKLDIYSATDQAGQDLLRLISNVGGEGNVVFRVDASGQIFSDSTLSIGGPADLAENYTAEDETIEEGDVVSVNEASPSSIIKSKTPYDPKMLGIISTKPGLLLSGDTVGGKPVALSGRVPIKVSTENGEIKPGDYLTSSTTPGVAMKALRPGPVIGKALEGFSQDTPGVTECSYTPGVSVLCGKILAFVNLSYADPLGLIAQISMDDQGNLVIPNLKVERLALDPSVSSTSIQIPDVSSQLASLEDRIANLENQLQKASPYEATASADLADISTTDTESSASASLLAELDKLTPYSLDLTPPDILLASSSAYLSDISVISDADIGGLLTAYDLDVSNSLQSFGQTTLGNTLIAGNLTIDGTFSIENGNEINTISTLYLQKSPLSSSIDIFNGKVTIDPNGTLKAVSVVASQLKVNQGKSTGSGRIPSGSVSAVIDNPYIEEGSIIIVNPLTPITQNLAVTAKSPKTDTKDASFTVSLAHPETFDVEFDYLVIGVKLSQMNQEAEGP